MAAPSGMTCKNLAGKFQLNKSLSDDLDPLLLLQGLSWLTRTAISLATVVLTIKTYDTDGVTHIDITSVASGLSTTQENRTLDWTFRDHNDRIFGQVRGRTHFSTEGEFEMQGEGSGQDRAFLEAKTLKDGKTPSRFLDTSHVQTFVKSTGGYDWIIEQVWGFEEINGKRFYTRRIVGWKGTQVQRVRLVYDYKGGAEDTTEDDGLAYGEES